MLKLSERIKTLPVSSIRKLTAYAAQAKKEGVKVHHLNIGDPDIKTPKVMLSVLKNWSIDTIRYAQSEGEPKLLTALTSYYKNLGFPNISEDNILVTLGGSEAIVIAFFAICDWGDEVIIFEPYYSNYASCAHFCGVKLVPVTTSIEEGFHLPSKKEIEQKIGKKTKAILFCSPNNPTGTIYTEEELEMLVSIAKKNNLFLISDEVYREFVFENKKHTSILKFLNKSPERIIMVDSLSKRYSLCGARLGVLLSFNKRVMAGAIKFAQGRLSAGLIEQLMASKLTKVPKSYTKRIIAEYRIRRNIMFKGLSKIKGVVLSKPEGAFYIMVSLPVENAEDFAIFLLKDFRLNNATVMLAPGAGFYVSVEQGLDQVRIAYVLKQDDLRFSIKILEEGLKAYKLKAGSA